MNKLGVNCARVFLTTGSFQPTVDTVNEDALRKLDKLVEIARASRIRLMLTGPDHWEGAAPYWRDDRFAGEQALKALEKFWTVVGGRYRGEPAIFAWDLLNEPHAPWFVEKWRPLWNTWLQSTYNNMDALKIAWGAELKPTDKWGDVAVPENREDSGNTRLRDWQLFREHIADEWVRRQAEAIRKVDPTHLITVGYIQWSYPLFRGGKPDIYSAFNPRRQVRWLDFITMHFYPLMGEPVHSKESWDKNLTYLQAVLAYCHVGKPVVLGEYGWYGGGAPQQYPYFSEAEQARWIRAEIEASRSLACGWLSWPFADTPSSTDMSLFGGLVKADMTVKAWGRVFQIYTANLSQLVQPTPQLPAVDIVPSLTAPMNDLTPLHQSYSEGVRKALNQLGHTDSIQLSCTLCHSERKVVE
jgi:endo-1,4-beta-mannosidase